MKKTLGIPRQLSAVVAGLVLSWGTLTGCRAASDSGSNTASSLPVAASAEVGKAAPDFKLTDLEGKERHLSDYKGKIVVLEWFNHGCPFVKKHYESGNMQKLQKSTTDKGVIWLAINSSAEGKQGFAAPSEHASAFKEKGAAPSAVLIDTDGTVGHLYGAKTTPHMFVIDKAGKLAYAGAIDDSPGVDQAEIPQAKNYVRAAVDDLLSNKPVATTSTKSYGCSVKYK